jgi:hypothetical protein
VVNADAVKRVVIIMTGHLLEKFYDCNRTKIGAIKQSPMLHRMGAAAPLR